MDLDDQGNATPGAELKSRRDTNYARSEAFRELLALRAAVPVLELELQLRRGANRLQVSSGHQPRTDATTSGSVWRETAESQLKQRVMVEAENRKLRARVEEARRVLWGLRSRLHRRSTSEAVKQFGADNCWSAAELPPFDYKIKGVIEDLSRRVDTIYAAVREGSILDLDDTLEGSAVSVVGTPTLIENNSDRRLVAKRVLPFNVDATAEATWEILSGDIRLHATSLFSFRSVENDNESVSTVIEYFGMKMVHEDACAEFRVSQVMRRYTGGNRDRQVVIWESVVDPISINDCRVEGGSFRETGRVLIRPHMWNESEADSAPEYAVSEVNYAIEALTPSSLSDVADISSFILRTMALNLSYRNIQIDNLLLGNNRSCNSSTVPVQAVKQFGGDNCWSPANLPTFEHKVKAVIEDLSRRVHAIYAAAKEVSVLGSDDVLQSSDVSPIGTPTLIESGSERRLVAKRLLPFSVHATTDATWEIFTSYIRLHATSLFSFRSMESDNDSVSTVIEYFGMRLVHEDACAEFRFSQVLRRYTGASCEVIIWQSIVDTVAISDCRVEGGSFRETGRVLIRPHMWTESEADSAPEYAVSEVNSAVEALTPSSFSDIADISGFILRTMALNLASSDLRIDNLLLTRSSSTTLSLPS